MIGRLLDSWQYVWPDIWEPILDHSKSTTELAIELYRPVADRLRRRLSYDELTSISNDPDLAATALRGIQKKDFKSEADAVSYCEDVYEALAEYGVDEIAILYVKLFGLFLKRYNLRYRLDEPFHLLIQVPWVYADIYYELQQVNKRDAHLMDLMNDFENAFSTFARTRKRRDLRTSIGKASNYAEGVAASRLGLDKGTLGKMCDELVKENAWPHNMVKESLQQLYGFCSDYPGIRHGSGKKSRARSLDEKDTIIISILLIAFTGYLSNQINFGKILS
ncbi:MAG: hypothetical protein KC546_09465 [Anaerolineae bacterium]|nr:hypothetical protein [Anaerolineae bacterium]